MDKREAEDVLDFGESEFPWPQAGKRLRDVDRQDHFIYGASLRVSWANPWDAYALGFKQLADLGVDALGDRKSRRINIAPETLVFSVMFNYRQYLELAMKVLIVEAEYLFDIRANKPVGHNLVALWTRLRQLLERQWPGAEPHDVVEEQIREFAAIDRTGEAFRYPVDKSGKPLFAGSESINLLQVREIVSAIASVFDGSGTGIHELLSNKYDESEYYE